MTLAEIKTKTEEINFQIAELERTEFELCAELGRNLLPELPEDSEHAPLAAKIKETYEKTTELRRVVTSLDEEYQDQIVALTCFYCKAVSPDGSRFCEECGAKLGEPPREYCKACGTMNGVTMKFCGECGAKLDEIVIAII